MEHDDGSHEENENGDEKNGGYDNGDGKQDERDVRVVSPQGLEP